MYLQQVRRVGESVMWVGCGWDVDGMWMICDVVMLRCDVEGMAWLWLRCDHGIDAICHVDTMWHGDDVIAIAMVRCDDATNVIIIS